ncbi:MAG: undecaprenyl-diphosphate phosphatase [Gemmatimonadota bacterium]|nr:undecaprenyl-diphosphate phosphatase [Gemmatimonadota bacterium]MDE3004778.1 undecaprenyl-diphosphate phosphatase [Gemmatimonadota bacterium]MDE3014480.1 undecaprenyl-diphosphate phosphatase [Gemmatimonadota bacterium]
MSLWESLILGIIQGATEFLPVSSSGHLVIAQNLLAVSIEGVAFEVAVHLATLVSILLVYRSRVTELVGGMLTGERAAFEYAGLVIVATIPAGILGVFAKDRVEALFDNPIVPGVALIVTGAILWSSRSPIERAKSERPTWQMALVIGLAQAFALIPGISRSGSTVVAAVWLGLEAREAAAFSFMMAVPAIAGAAVLQVPDVGAGGPEGLSVSILLLGGIASGVTGVLAIRTFVAMLARRSFHFFAPYCWVIGALYLAFVTLR